MVPDADKPRPWLARARYRHVAVSRGAQEGTDFSIRKICVWDDDWTGFSALRGALNQSLGNTIWCHIGHIAPQLLGS